MSAFICWPYAWCFFSKNIKISSFHHSESVNCGSRLDVLLVGRNYLTVVKINTDNEKLKYLPGLHDGFNNPPGVCDPPVNKL